MKFEKLNENKIRIILNLEDLKEKNIDFHSFMSNSIESQTLFLDMLDEAEKKVGFVTKDHRLMIEALATTDGNFILTVTRDLLTQEAEKAKRKKVHIKRKSIDLDKPIAIYSFCSFDDFCLFCNFIENSNLKEFISFVGKISLYNYQEQYYLCFKNIRSNLDLLKGFCTAITEFGAYVCDPELFERKLIEYGSVIIKKDAIKIANTYFSKNPQSPKR